MKRTKNKPTRRDTRNQLLSKYAEPPKLPFIAHIYELRKRLFYIAVAVGLFGGIAVFVQGQLTALLLEPAGRQQFIYTSPGGGFDFAFRICLYAGVTLSIPVIVYQIIRYLEPLVKKETMSFVAWTSISSSVLAFGGTVFGYLVGLPAGLHFLLQGFSSDQIKALISIQSYLSFVITYLLGCAILFQLPLLLILINRIKPLKPRKLMGYQKWVIVGSFVLGAIISPSPDIRNQAIMSGPIILMYELSIVLIWLINRKHRKPKKVVELLRKDSELQAARIAKFTEAQETWKSVLQAARAETATTPRPAAPQPKPEVPVIQKQPEKSRPQQYLEDFRPRQYQSLSGRSPQPE